MPSQDEWNKYLDEQELAVERALREQTEPVQTSAKPMVRSRLAPPIISTPLRTPVPAVTPPISTPEVIVTTEPPMEAKQMPLTINEPSESVSEAAIVQQAVRMRKRLPEQLVAADAGDREIAQKSYKGFRETREELLGRLLDPQLSLEDTARILNVCPTTVRRYTNRGLLRHIRTAGNQRRFRLSDVLAFLESHGSGEISD